MEWSEGDLVWFDPNIGHPLPGEIQEVHQAAQVIIVQALINGKVSTILEIEFISIEYQRMKFLEKLRVVFKWRERIQIPKI